MDDSKNHLYYGDSRKIIPVHSTVEAMEADENIMAKGRTWVVITRCNNYIAITNDISVVYIYEINPSTRPYISAIMNSDLMKICSKVYCHFEGVKCEYIIDYITSKLKQPRVYKLKRELIKLGAITDPKERIAKIALIIAKYKIRADESAKYNTRVFDAKRECHLLYLTIFNDILSRFGPMDVNNLFIEARKYPNLCRMDADLFEILNELTATRALVYDPRSLTVSIN